MSFVRNKAQFSKDKIALMAIEAYEHGVRAVQPKSLLLNCCRVQGNTLMVREKKYSLSGRVFVIGAGKASAHMASIVEKMIGEHISAGWVNAPLKVATKKIQIAETSHPLPSRQNIEATAKMVNGLKKAKLTEHDIVLCLISGGGSALLELLPKEISLDDIITTHHLLIKSGASIQEINTVRKHISLVKGGQLAKTCAPTKVITFVISDVIGNDLSSIASGPTVVDATTFKQAMSILQKYVKNVPLSVKNYIEKGRKGLIAETPKKLQNSTAYILGDNTTATEATVKYLRSKKQNVEYVQAPVAGNADDVAERIIELMQTKQKPFFLVFGGECTVQVSGTGNGGRNMHLAALIARWTTELKHAVVLCAGSDGQDYIPGIAGACFSSKIHAEKLIHLLPAYEEYVANCDTLNLHSQLGTLLKAQPTGTNVCDIGMVYAR